MAEPKDKETSDEKPELKRGDRLLDKPLTDPDGGLVHGYPAEYWDNDSPDEPKSRYSPEAQAQAKQLTERLRKAAEAQRNKAG